MDYADWTYSPSHRVDHCAWLSRVITIHAFGCSARPAFRLPNTEYRTVSPFLNVEAWAFQPKIENSGEDTATEKQPQMRTKLPWPNSAIIGTFWRLCLFSTNRTRIVTIQSAHIIYQHSHFIVTVLLSKLSRFGRSNVGNIHSKIVNQYMMHVT